MTYWYVMIKDDPHRQYIPVAGPYPSKDEAEQVCDEAVRHIVNQRPELYFYEHGVGGCSLWRRSIFGAPTPETLDAVYSQWAKKAQPQPA